MNDTYDLIIIGAGQGGPALSATLAGRGQRVALIEQRALGGTCVNDGCTPTKTLRKSARVAHMARRASDFGIVTGPVEVDFEAAMVRMAGVVNASVGRLERGLGSIDGLTIINERGTVAGHEAGLFRVAVGSGTVYSPKLILNTGTRPFVPPIDGLRDAPYLDNTSLLQLRKRPAHLVVLGGSYIGLEMGQIFGRLGSQVTIIEQGDRVATREDPDISEAIADMLRAEGIEVVTGATVNRVRSHAGTIEVGLDTGEVVTGSHLLVAGGRVPNTDRMGLDAIGVEVTERGYVVTNDRLETSVDGVWALGDINGRGAFTHTSYHDHEILLANMGGADRGTDDRIPTYAMFTDPPLGHVGIYERDAAALVATGRSISQAVVPMSDVSRAREEGETTGVIKLLIDEDSGRFLGATLLGIGADEIVQVIGQVMAADGTWRTVREALPIHPTVTEFLPTIIDRRRPLTP